jgi:hypothetical protein
VNGNSTRRVVVEPNGTAVVAHVGLHALGSFADRLGLGDALSAAIPWAGGGFPVHDRGKVLVQMALVLAGGGESCLDVEHLRIGDDLFGSVPSDTTVARTFHEISASTRDGIADALAGVRAEVWRRSEATTGPGPVVLDIDASLVEVLGGERGSGTHLQGRLRFSPDVLLRRPDGRDAGRAAASGERRGQHVADHVTVLDAALAQLPAEITAGHRAGDDPDLVGRDVVVRADSAGCTEGFLSACRDRNVGFFVSARSNAQVTAAIFDAIGIEEVWLPSLSQDGEENDERAVAELTSLIDTTRLPEGTRLVVRRQPLHPGAQRSLFPSLDYRYWGFYTDQDGDPRQLDVTMRAHAHVEQHIGRLKDSGLTRLPFISFEANANWLTTVALAADLVRWFQLLCCHGYWQDARPKALRWGIFGAPGRLVHRARRRIVRIVDGWPTTDVLLDAYRRIELLT